MKNPKTQDRKLFSLIMAGGSGTRFWPESTQGRPKQYLQLISEKTLIEETLERLQGLVEKENRFIVTTLEQEALAKEYGKRYIEDGNIIFEPCPRNTAPCILLSLAYLMHRGASLEDVVAILPADHVILNTQGFQKTLKGAAHLAGLHRSIVTIGIAPYFPHTGYGYIQKGKKLESLDDKSPQAFVVSKFKEKPNLTKAKAYLTSGEYFWNAGMFVAPLGLLLEEFMKHSPEISSYWPRFEKSLQKDDAPQLKEDYQRIPSISIDYAVMEKSSAVAVVPAEFDWNDLGSWDALESVCKRVEGNILVSQDSPHYFDQSSGNIILAQEGQFISLVGIQDLIIVSNPRALMVLPKKDAQKIKEIVEFLKKEGLQEFL